MLQSSLIRLLGKQMSRREHQVGLSSAVTAILVWVAMLMCAPPAYADAVDAGAQSITVALTQDPPNLDSTRTVDLVSVFVLGHIQEGLLRYDRRGRVAPGVAQSWELAGNRMSFELNPAARWHDGTPITAHDFVYAWRLLVDPASAAPYASIMYPIKNAEEIQKGQLPPGALGVRDEGDHRLIVELAFPCGFCLKLMIHAAFLPVNEAFHRARSARYGAAPGDLLYNGPFRLESWTRGQGLTMVRNETYWNDAQTHLNTIRVGYITEDNRTRLNLFKDQRIALVRLGTETVQEAMTGGLRLRTFLSGGVAFMRLNLREGRATAHPALRRAMRATMDTEAFVNRVIAVPGYRPAGGLFPAWLSDIEPEAPLTLDLAGAKNLVASLPDDEPRVLTLLTTTSPTGLRIAEYFQGHWKRTLGLDVKVDQQVFKQYLDKSQRGEFDVALSSWYPDFDDVMTFADLLASWNANNRGAYASAEYDEAVRALQRSIHPDERAAAIEVMKRLIAAEVPVLPLAETGSAYIQHSRLRGVVRRVVGPDPDYTLARVVQNIGTAGVTPSAQTSD